MEVYFFYYHQYFYIEWNSYFFGGHWILLAYFLNYVVKNKNYRNNNILIIVLSSGIHFYFTAMLLIKDLIINFFKLFLRKQKINFFKDFFLKIFFLGFFMYLLGYFVLNPQDNLGGGFGIFKMNLISFFDPGVSTIGQKYLWSNFLPDLKLITVNMKDSVILV